ncbi:MAG: FAD-dependent oxidoreductase, partial [Burkholderiaceae bacterium]
MSGVVIIGAGHAAAQLCASLREQKVEGPITVVGNEGQLPYHRPPLSKTFVKDDQTPVPAIRPASYYEKLGVTLVLDDAATAIDREARRLTLASGRTLDYDWLVIATGARARRLPTIPPGTGRVHELRNAADALGLRQAFAGIDSLTVIGGGFIGLEIAATARQLGKRARVIEAAGRLLGRAVSPELSDYLLRTHREAGIDIALEARIDEVVVEDGELVALVVDGQREPVEALVVGIGAEPVVELAKAAGLDCANGVVVDASMRTADPTILAIGDCVSFPRSTGEGMLRLESVQNANDQARCAALTIAGRPAPYAAP